MGLFVVSGIPDIFMAENLLETLGRNNFAIIYDVVSKRSCIWLEDGKDDLIRKLELSIQGFTTVTASGISLGKMNVFSFYRISEEKEDPMHDLFAQNLNNSLVIVVFITANEKEIEYAKQYAESLLSSKGIRQTEQGERGLQGLFGSSSSIHRDLYKDSEEIMMAKSILYSINSAISKNHLLYKTFVLFREEDGEIGEYLKNRFAILAEMKVTANDFSVLVNKISRIRAFTFGTAYCSNFINFYGSRKLRTVKTEPISNSTSGIPIGKLMQNAVSESSGDVCIEISSLNLGVLITGLPGSGKTMEAMHLIDRIINSSHTPTFVIAPSEEWDTFAISHGMNLIRLFSDSLNINFFRCPQMANKDKFCQGLAIILSSAAGAGPFRRPMEKCMLNAFRKVYQDTTTPDPVDVYHEIEESIISLHGKRTHTGVKYTKHGENVKAALESLRIILNDPNYSTRNGLNFEELLVGGAVFDMSAASTATRSFLYALVLNQLYSITSRFDTKGDDELRMLICVEEAQIIFKDELSPAVEDLKQRIQDFRKRGIGLMLMAHNISDIELGIRRLCQTRLYMKQAPDSAYIAAKDLIFPEVEPEKVVEKLKLLDSRVGALSFITRKGKEKIQEETVFVKTEAFLQPTVNIPPLLNTIKSINVHIEVTFGDGFDSSEVYLQIMYLNEPLSRLALKDLLNTNLVEERKYSFCLLNAKERKLAETSITARTKVKLFVDKNKIMEML
jgi:hypothetical protein